MEKEYRKSNKYKDMINCPNCNRKSLVLYSVSKIQTIYGHCSTPTCKYWHKKSERTKENAIVIDTTKFTTKNHKNHNVIMQNIVNVNKQDYLSVLKSIKGFNLKEFNY